MTIQSTAAPMRAVGPNDKHAAALPALPESGAWHGPCKTMQYPVILEALMASEARPISTRSRASGNTSGKKRQTDLWNKLRSRCNRAILGLPNGFQVPCGVEELSEAGAYLIRSGNARGQGSIQVGDHVAVQLFQASTNAVESVILDAKVVRLEAENGAGLALRFVAAEQDEESPYNGVSQDDWMTEVPEIARLAATVTATGSSKGVLLDFRDFTSSNTTEAKATEAVPASILLRRLMRPLLWAGAGTTCLALFILFSDWLGAVL